VSTSPDTRPDYTTLQSINGLASTDVSLPAGSPFSITSHLKIGNFPGTQDTTNYGMCQFVLSRQLGDDDGNDLELVTYRLLADYPVAVPDAAGIGKITDISGGVSKFGGLRLFASDDIGNLYMLRQRRVYDVSNPYTAPIYIQNDENGNPATFSTTQLMSLPSAQPPIRTCRATTSGWRISTWTPAASRTRKRKGMSPITSF
jgi:hypothetical protein